MMTENKPKERDIRLPEGYSSWTQLSKFIMSQDEINVSRNSDVFYSVCNAPNWESNNHEVLVHENFRCDVLTLKVRAFDELNEILPDVEDLLDAKNQMMYLLHQSIGFSDIKDNKALTLIQSLIDLLTEKSR